MFEIAELWNTCQGKLLTGSGTKLRRKKFAVNKDEKGVGDLKTALIPDKERQSLEFALLVFCLVLGITVK